MFFKIRLFFFHYWHQIILVKPSEADPGANGESCGKIKERVSKENGPILFWRTQIFGKLPLGLASLGQQKHLKIQMGFW